jgi:hypothetical protein
MEIFRAYTFFDKIISAYKTRSTSVIHKENTTRSSKMHIPKTEEKLTFYGVL